MTVKITSARIDERGKAYGGKAGDQTGKEVFTQDWYLHSKGWYVLRPIDLAVAKIIADTAEALAADNLVGYDQHQRDTLWDEVKKAGYDPDAIDSPVETDCSAMVRVCCAHAGIVVSNFTTATEVSRLMATGKFKKLTADKYCKHPDLLRRGDILCTRSQGHTVTVTTDGPGAEYPLGGRALCEDCFGDDVELLQAHLKTLGYGALLGRWGEDKDGVDSDYGTATTAAVKAFQKDHALATTGKADVATISAVIAAIEAKENPVVLPDEPDEPDNDDAQEDEPDDPVVPADPTQPSEAIPNYMCPWVIATASLNVRTGPGTSYKRKIALFPGTGLMYDGETRNGWYAVLFRGKRHWVSSKYSKIEMREKYVVDMSVYDDVEDWDTFVKFISFAWLRVACRRKTEKGEVYVDANFKRYAAELKKQGVPFGVYVYGRADTKARGVEEAAFAVTTAEPYGPTVYMYDIEAPTLTQASCQAFIDEAERLTGKPCGIYVGHHWSQVNAGAIRRAYTVCPYYRDNGGGTHGDRNPSHDHDAHQYSCSLIVPGKKDPGDVSHINADPKTNGTGHGILWFRTGGKQGA